MPDSDVQWHTLKRDICGLRRPGSQRRDVPQKTIDTCLPPEVQYATRYWVRHLKESKSSIDDNSTAYYFLTRHLLHWLEVMSLLGRLFDTIGLVDDLLGLVDVCICLQRFSRPADWDPPACRRD